MRPVEAYADLLRLGVPIVTTNEAATRLGISISSATQRLRSMEEAGLVLRLRRGLWTLDRDVDPFVVAPHLTAPYPAYVSFWSALAHHDMIEQIPRRVFVASPDRSRKIATTIGSYSIHHLLPEIFDGFEGSQAQGYLAIPEKAFFDTVYIRAARGAQTYFPELTLPPDFDNDRLDDWLRRIPVKRVRTLVSRNIEQAIEQATILA